MQICLDDLDCYENIKVTKEVKETTEVTRHIIRKHFEVHPDTIYNANCMDGMANIEPEMIDLIVTDPPYDVDMKNKSKHLMTRFSVEKARQKQVNRDQAFHDLDIDYEELSHKFFSLLKKDAHCYIFCGENQYGDWMNTMIDAGFKFANCLIWVKNKQSITLAQGYKYNHKTEFCLFFRKGVKKIKNFGANNVLNYPTATSLDHPTQKPVAMFEYLIKQSSNEGDIVLDPFMGSGTTAVACKRQDRRFIGFELNPAYVELCNQRISNVPKKLSFF